LNAGIPIIERFWMKVTKRGRRVKGVRGRCWEWTGALDTHGYGQIAENKPEGSSKPAPRYLAHRFSYRLHFGEIGVGLVIMHRCDNPVCVRPTHLKMGTHEDNVRDRGSKNRTARGAATINGGAKLYAETVREMRRRYAAGGTTCAKLGKEFGVAGPTATHAIFRRTWKHVA
jgi:hypothetical protein